MAAPWHVRSSWTRDQTSVPCVARQTLNHWITREVTPTGLLEQGRGKKHGLEAVEGPSRRTGLEQEADKP